MYGFVFQADLAKKNEDLQALKQQHELLKKMLYQQEQVCIMKTSVSSFKYREDIVI